MPASRLPLDHPLRTALCDEAHARPPARVGERSVVSVLALLEAPAEDVLAAVLDLARSQSVAATAQPSAAHVVIELAALRIKWERHGEFSSLTLVAPLPPGGADSLDPARYPSAFDAVPSDWLSALPGKVIAACDIVVLPGEFASFVDMAERQFEQDTMAGSVVLDGAARIFTDFVVRGDGRSRWLILNAGMGRAQAARTVQRVIEIEVYRMVALLGFPSARAAFGDLTRIERELERMTAAIAALHAEAATPATQREERRLLDELTRVAAELEQMTARTAFRYAASQAYWDIVRARVTELREQRIGDLRTLSGFLMRRLTPAMNSCAAAARRQEGLSARIERAGSLLRTRVDVAREEQNQQLLAAMDRRGKLQLRLQQTVEGLSVAAIAYYVVGLLGYLLKPLGSVWPGFEVEWATAASIPVIALLVWRGLQRVRRRIEAD
ncbi:MAG: DUF3422 family protein [Betaproteobacteria bacterium]